MCLYHHFLQILRIFRQSNDTSLLTFAILRDGLIADGGNLDDAAVAIGGDRKVAFLIAYRSLDECGIGTGEEHDIGESQRIALVIHNLSCDVLRHHL